MRLNNCKECIHYRLRERLIDYCNKEKITINPAWIKTNQTCREFEDKVERLFEL